MHLLVRIAFIGLVAWQATAATALHGERLAATSAATDWGHALAATTTQRCERVLGTDAGLLTTLPPLCPPGLVVLHERVGGSLDDLRRRTTSEQELAAAFARLAARNGLWLQWTALLYPQPFLLGVTDAITVAEHEARAGRPRWLLTLPGDPEPRDRTGWVVVQSSAQFTVWRCPTGS